MKAEAVERETEDDLDDGEDGGADTDKDAALEDAMLLRDGLQRDARAVVAEARPIVRRLRTFMFLH